MVLVPSARARGWVKVKLAKHLFEHRYDYRTEWLRFTETIGRAGADAPPLGERIVKAFADVVDAPGGLLLVGDSGGSVTRGRQLVLARRQIRLPACLADLRAILEPRSRSSGRIIEFEGAARRLGKRARTSRSRCPPWMLDEPFGLGRHPAAPPAAAGRRS